jgi:hypothetical protein
VFRNRHAIDLAVHFRRVVDPILRQGRAHDLSSASTSAKTVGKRVPPLQQPVFHDEIVAVDVDEVTDLVRRRSCVRRIPA